MGSTFRFTIESEHDAVAARSKARELAHRLGFSPRRTTAIIATTSELTRNILQYAESGCVEITMLTRDGRSGIEVHATDTGPGIPNIGQAMQAGYSTSGGLGLGLPGVKRLVDEFRIDSSDDGTDVIARIWDSSPSGAWTGV